MVQAVSTFVSTLSLSAIAIDRYNLIVRPHVQTLSVKGATNIAIVLWIVSVIVSLPYGFYMTLESYDSICGQVDWLFINNVNSALIQFCTEYWPSKSIQRGYALIVLVMQFLLPFLTMSFCYATIFSRLRERANSKLRKLNERSKLLSIKTSVQSGEEQSPNKHKEASPQQSVEGIQRTTLLNQQKRTTSILASMVLIFGIAWLPHNIYTLLMEYDEEILNIKGVNYTYIVSMAAHCISMTTNVSNPILYAAWLNPTFKKLFMQTFRSEELTG